MCASAIDCREKERQMIFLSIKGAVAVISGIGDENININLVILRI